MTSTQTDKPFTVERVAPVFFLILVDILGLTVILPLLHLYAARFNATPVQIGWVVAAFPLSQLIGVPVMGSLSDRFGRKPLLLISQFTTCAGFILLGIANSLWMIVLSRVVDGLFGANIATAQAALTDITDDTNRTQALGLIGAAFGLGFVFGPLISAISLSFTDRLSIPAFIAAGYSALSIILTLTLFQETLPAKDHQQNPRIPLRDRMRLLTGSSISLHLILMFAQQVIFFGFESLLGIFTLSRLGLLGEGNAYIFLVVGIILVMVQGRYIGKWSRQYGDFRLVQGALLLIALGMVLVAFTPRQPPLNYFRVRAERELLVRQQDGETEAMSIDLPKTEDRGLWGVPWLLVSIIPLSIGAGLIRPSLNSIMTKRVSLHDYGLVLGFSAAVVSAANAIAPIVGGTIFQSYGTTAPFLWGGVLMGVLGMMSLILLRQ